MSGTRLLDDVREEGRKGCFGDGRLTKRMAASVDALLRHPDASFPSAMEDPAKLEGFYRFLSNQKVTPERVLESHVAATVGRARQVRDVIAIHDTTEIAPPGARAVDGFYDLQDKRCGFLAHFTLLVAADEPFPLGVSKCSIITRVPRPKVDWRKRWAEEDKESRRWWTCAEDVATQLGDGVRVVHVMDREADSYEIFSTLMNAQQTFVIRVHHDRRAKGEDAELVEKLSAVLEARPVVVEREVQLSARRGSTAPDKKRKHPARLSRCARLEVRAARVLIERPRTLPSSLPPVLAANVVFVTEPAPPANTPAVVWKLITTLPIDTPEEVSRVIDTYRGRWLIEEFFKALKTGCAFEQRPLESLKTCSTALALFTPIAVQLLLLRYLSRQLPTAPATAVFTTQQVAALRHFASGDRRLPPRASVRHAMLAVAGLGGHLKSNGDPGWEILGRGYIRLCEKMSQDSYGPPKTSVRTGTGRM